MPTTDPAAEPAAYWTGVAYQALIAFTRAHLAEQGITQPQFWLLRNLSPADLSPDGAPMTVPELRAAMATYLRAEDDLDAESEALVAKGQLSRDEAGGLTITEAGERARVAVKATTPRLRERIHEGVDDADYVAALGVLRRMIRNVS
ncbi:winged helix-turn-helix transcriptional regulator [Actinosynnema pretiosum subsp. pretiosum]|uniref:Transcriptional regulator, MarR family n=2 Tax=Actinosynnema TaxID=40566 RepID=C6WQN8_ACTMD|nr:MarR family winged helix-turn-helix transcriptional regulator [Actinosynnema mirum]ACU38728.1 hypothetical protein Amir_4902 [Actinosynnema mirum DSM 43827]AXX32325.1 hypothetical protein APASM_4960 [Actinosynnema pretiosum subsp. pretiosum]QUF03730.1 winged helix-turn-helix transcriptional regulator [Actinosynnema pretiosum subsp. pretiosum]